MSFVADGASKANSKYYPFYRWRENWQNLVDTFGDRCLTPGIKRILIRLSRNLDRNKWTATVGTEKLAQQCRTSRGFASRAVKVAEGVGLLDVRRIKKSSGTHDDCNVYILLTPGTPFPPDGAPAGLRLSHCGGDSGRVTGGDSGRAIAKFW
jgi:hypothetical protein